MAYYYGTMQGSRSCVTTCGTKRSGIAATLATWGVGIRVTLEHDANSGEDVLTLERIPWTSAADADAPGETLLTMPLTQHEVA